MDLWIIKGLVGMLVGTLIGLSGVGGGVLLLPILIFGLGVPPIVAVGSDATFNAFTKVGAGILHWRQRTVNWRLAGALATGSIPGSFLGIALLTHLRAIYGDGVNGILRTIIGILLVAVPLLLIFQASLEQHFAVRRAAFQDSFPIVAGIGLVAGFLVGISSVGSGSIIMLLLMLFTGCSPIVLVGTDIVHAVALTGFTGAMHWHLGNVDPGLVIPLLVGSIPGSLLGVRLSTILPSPWLRRVLCALLVVTGVRMLWV